LKGNAMKLKYRDLLCVLSAFVFGLAAILPCGGCAIDAPGCRGSVSFPLRVGYSTLVTITGGIVGYQSDELGEGLAVGAAISWALFWADCWFREQELKREQKLKENLQASYEEAYYNTIAPFYGDASKGIVELSASSGETVKINAAGSSDPDADQLSD
jgi:hypothetical protein